MNVSQVAAWMDTIAPFETALGFDNVGLLVGDAAQTVHHIGLALDVTNPLIEQAAHMGIDLMVTHHPVIFDPLKRVTADSPVYRLIRAGISCLAAHTNLDAAPGGTNDSIGDALGLCYDAPAWLDGMGRTALLQEPMELAKLAAQIKAVSHASAVRYYDAGKPVQKLCWVAGSGGSELEAVLAHGCDTFVTGDVKHDRFVLAENAGINLVEWNHFDSEHLVLEPLKVRMEEALGLPVTLLRNENCLKSL